MHIFHIKVNFSKWSLQNLALQNWVNWGNGFAIGDTNNKTNPYNVLFSSLMKKAQHACIALPVRRAIKLTISERDWHFVAQFSKNQVDIKELSLTFSVHYSYIDLLWSFHCHGPLKTWENDLKGFVAFKAVIRVNDTNFNFLVNISRSKCQLLPRGSSVVFVFFRCQAFHIIT